ncbi:glutamine--tRNA ligase/YqeY domain fusion protein [Fuerstiella marisgermanici]|uniref:Glutamine--tRNA ligase n=1 Tax=Fuerstiella marisgermanici TaxID=1891926 RepID=A0A1P8WJU1_9PLAN|nr:glutamine--tRNA ligase/YqeY domain fusion protein [Fuerstiella marisgermanici]APZ94332.1 Glutamine--tRNA ligase [Fuerstiella marisgermanici]
MSEANSSETVHKDFVRQIVEDDLKTGKWDGVVHTRFPPEPNGYLHIGHAKSICLNFGIAAEYGGKCNLRFDDTNPEKEEVEYVESIKEDIRWLGFDWEDRLFFASDYFEQLYQWAEQLITDGKAYVCSLPLEEIRTGRGTPTEPGTPSPYRDRSVEENLTLFRGMRNGEFDEGVHVLRAKIDMAHKVLLLRDPIMYRIRKVEHHRTGDAWCIYPTYDFTHGQSDSLEGITHSICTLEFENRRPLYDWYCETLGIHHPQQIEFNRLNLTYTLMSKRRLLQLVNEGHVSGWNDPRMPTLSGLRRRGYTPDSIRKLCESVGVTKHNAMTDMVVLENQIREELNATADRRMAVLDPLKVVITNYPESQSEELDAVNNPEDEAAGSRKVPFGRELYIERDDFMEDPPRKFFRLGPGREVRLRWAYFIKCNDVVQDDDGNITEIHCTYDVETKGGNAPDGRKVKATMHWVSAQHAISAEVRLYDHLFVTEDPDDVEDESQTWQSNLNPDSLTVVEAKLEPSLAESKLGDRCQFERKGYFIVDQDSTSDRLVFNRIVTLKDAWAKAKKK